MNTAPTPAPSPAPAQPAAKPTLKIFGIGSAGHGVLEQVAARALSGAVCVAVGADAKPQGAGPAAETIVLESKVLRGLGTGGDPERGRAVAEENEQKLREACAGAEVVFIVAGLGGGGGTGISPVLARLAKEAGAFVLAFVTLPFDCEGNRRRSQALNGLARLKAEADGVICLPNQKVFKLIDDQTSVVDTFKITNELLAGGVDGVWRLLARRGLIDIHFADLCALLRDRHGESTFAAAQGEGPTRSREVVDKLFAHPMLDGGKTLTEADAVLVSLVGGPDLTMAEVNRVMEHINGKCPRAQVVMGAAIDEGAHDRLSITVIASRRGVAGSARAESDDLAQAEAPQREERPESQFLDHEPGARPQSRFVPPPPPMTQEKMEQLVARQGAGTGRGRGRAGARLRQGQLPLDIVSKGRFDKSEPTIHKGEDLDVPTYIRRGVSLN
jgi:cell division protein FtsZ